MPQLVQLSHAQWSQHPEVWNDLWRRSESRLPTNMASAIDLWRESFAPDAEMIALVVQDGQRWLAGMPLLSRRRGPFQFYEFPSNCTVAAGDLLADPDSESSSIPLLAEGLANLPNSVVVLKGIEIESSRWQRLIEALQSRGLPTHQSRGHDVGIVDVLHDWDAYQKSWSRNHRSAIKRTRNKLRSEGNVTVRRVQAASDDELHSLLETCFEIEDRSWKGDGGTSILRTPGLREYYHREARLMRDRRMLDLWLLQLDGQTIAFEYCHFAKGICLSHKISFDPAWESFSPGRLLRYFQLEQYHGDRSCTQLDTLGVLCEAKAKWITRRYRSTRLAIGVGRGWPSFAIRGMKWIRSIRDQRRGELPAPIKAGAESYLQTAVPPASIAPLPCAVDAMPLRSSTPTL